MNDADLKKLTVKPGKLEPQFNRDVTFYSITLPSSATFLSINPITSDSDASWNILGNGNSRTIPVENGEEKDIVIEVSAEDGTTKQYVIHLVVLSLSNATLTDIKLSHGKLSPSFQDCIFDYVVNLPWHLMVVTLLPEATDKDIDGANKNIDISLNYGETLKILSVVSPDKKCKREYSIKFIKDKILRMVNTVDISPSKYCSICLGIFHCPVSTNQKQNLTERRYLYCRKCIEMLTRTRKLDPFTDMPLLGDFIFHEINMEEKISNSKVFCCYKKLGCNEEVYLYQLGSHMRGCNFQPVLAPTYEGVISEKQIEKIEKLAICKMCSHSVAKDDVVTHLKWYCPAKRPNTKVDHIVELRDWEKKLQENGLNQSADPEAEIMLGNKANISQLQIAAERYAVTIKMKPRNHATHFRLATVLEEMYYSEDIWGCKAQDIADEDEDKMLENLMDIASDSSKEEEIKAICKAKGLSENAPLAYVLKALDEEYHDLLDQSQSGKADYAQKLYAWKSKQGGSSRNRDKRVVDDAYLNKALLKYLDASACDPNKSYLHMHVGRILLMQGKYEDAIKKLEAAFGLKPTSIEARFYLGLAYVKLYGRQHSQHLNPIKYLQDGVDFALYNLFEDPDVDFPRCSAELFVRHSNTLILEGMLELAHLHKEKESPTENDKNLIIEMYKQTSSLSIQLMYDIKHRNTTYQQLQWTALRAQFSLGAFMMNEFRQKTSLSNEDKKSLYGYWERLSALSRAFELTANHSILKLQRKICEEVVTLFPSSSRSLCHLGDIQLMTYDLDSNIDEGFLKEAENSYRASIQFEGKKMYGKEISFMIKESQWWKDRQENEKKNQTRETKAPSKTAAGPPPKPGTSTAKSPSKSLPSARGPSKSNQTVQAKTTTAKSKTTVNIPKGKPATSPNVATKGKLIAPPTKGRNPPLKTAGAVPAKKSGKSLVKSPKSSHSCVANTKAPEDGPSAATKSSGIDVQGVDKKEEKVEDQAQEDNTINELNYKPRLGLARVLSRADKDFHWGEIKQLYTEVIKMEPDVYDAYIELAELVSESDAKQALEVYCKYPFKKERTFDDAYLHGDIIRLIIKLEDFDNSNLETSMVEYGKIMGFSALEKTVTVLENKFKFETLKNVYAKIIEKDINDQELQDFFKFKCWV